jgi:hypothetical protein
MVEIATFENINPSLDVLVFFGNHSNYYTEEQRRVIHPVLEQYLSQTSKNIEIILEYPDMLGHFDDRFKAIKAQGISNEQALFETYYRSWIDGYVQDLVSDETMTQKREEEYPTEQTYQRNFALIVDELNERFPGRISLSFENLTEEEIERLNVLSDAEDVALTSALLETYRGNPDKALEEYEVALQNNNEHIGIRDKGIADSVIQKTANKDLLAVPVVGLRHQGIANLVEANGLNVSKAPMTDYETISPLTILEVKKYVDGFELTEYDTLKTLVLTVMTQLIVNKNQQPFNFVASSISSKIDNLFPNLQSIKDFLALAKVDIANWNNVQQIIE